MAVDQRSIATVKASAPSNGQGQSIELCFTENALTVLRKRYLRKGPDELPVETVEEMLRRVARTVAAPDSEHGQDAAQTEKTFYDLLTQIRFFPNSPTFTGAGTPLGQLAACFVLPIEDDMGRNPDGIFSTLRNAALIQQTGGGNGFSFSRLRPKGARVHTSAGVATGPVGFLKVYDKAFGEIAQGGSRRGANMAVLRVDHPDILEFIRCKSSEGEISNFNISVGITDAFMEAVEQDADFALINPQDGTVWSTVRARKVFDEIVKFAHHNGEPGVLFLDAANRTNPVPHLYELEATNPCILGDTWVTTDEGPQQAKDLVGKPVRLLLNGAFYPSDGEGFFPTGERDILAIHTRRGFRIAVTPDHPLRTVVRLTRHTLATDWRKAGDLAVGEQVVLGDNRGAVWDGPGGWDEGYLVGLLVGDGTITHGRAVLSVWGDGAGSQAIRQEIERVATAFPHRAGFQGFVSIPGRKERRLTLKAVYHLALEYGLSETFKGVSPVIERTSSAFHEGFLRGLFDADGTVVGTQTKGVSVRLAQSDAAVLEGVQRMLHRLGIVATLYRERRPAGIADLPDGRGGMQKYPIRAQHELVISRENLVEFASRIGFTDLEKKSRLDERLQAYRRQMNRERFVDEIVAIEPQGKAPVYDVRVPEAHAFDANGFWVHNCGEQFLGPYENCCLGSINLARHITDSDKIDWEGLRETIEQTTHFLDNVVSANRYVPAVPQLQEAAHRNRRIGLGFMGLGDVMYRLGVRYGSEEAQELASQIAEFIRFHAMQTSIDLARSRGPFPAISGSIYDPQNLQWQPPVPLRPHERDFGRPALDWDEIVQGIRRYGIRNAAQTTVAPTGTISTVAGCEAYGCEPVFALAYTRHVDDNGRDVELQYVSPLFERALKRANIDADRFETIIRQVRRAGSCQDVPNVPDDIRHTFVVAQDIGPEEHVYMQAAIQAFIDNSLSKTINFSEDATEQDVAKAYMLAWKLGCKGLTVYVTGSRKKVVLETEATRQAKSKPTLLQNAPALIVKPRPRRMTGSTYRVLTPLGKAYVTVNHNGDNEPFEVFLNVGKAGSETAAMSEAIGRLISLCLRQPSTLPGHERLGNVVNELRGIGGFRAIGFGPRQVRSLPDGVAQALAEHIDLPVENNGYDKDSAEQLPLFPHADLCPECGHAALVREEGCRKCYACGFSEC
ncbi:MAG: ribonucleoside reductase class II [Chloroflexi bacterium]|nr:ribonucleoside reductase class II [Chloroflexota bacterium]